jgi:phage gp37-like protein
MLEILAGTAPAAASELHNIESAILVRLSGLMAEHGGPLRHLGPYNGEEANSDDAEQEFFQALQGRAPAMLVAIASSTDDSRSTRATDYLERVVVEVLAVSAHARDAVAATRGTGAGDPGIYHLIWAARSLLAGMACGVAGTGHIRPTGQTPLIQRRGLYARRVTFAVAYHLEQPLREPGPEQWAGLLATARLSPAGLELAVQL